MHSLNLYFWSYKFLASSQWRVIKNRKFLLSENRKTWVCAHGGAHQFQYNKTWGSWGSVASLHSPAQPLPCWADFLPPQSYCWKQVQDFRGISEGGRVLCQEDSGMQCGQDWINKVLKPTITLWWRNSWLPLCMLSSQISHSGRLHSQTAAVLEPWYY